jgi:hypothetical protein
MRRIISLVSAALSLAACSNLTAPGNGDRAADAAKAKAALAAAAKATAAGGANGRLIGN